jgi:hypothetical protein
MDTSKNPRPTYPKAAMEMAKAKMNTQASSRDLVDGMLPKGSYGILYGDGGVGKSYLAFQMLLSISSGAPLFGKPTRKGRCFFYQSADDKQELSLRRKAITSSFTSDQVAAQDVDLTYAIPEARNRILFMTDANGELIPTETFARFRQACLDAEDLELIVVDSALHSMLIDLSDPKTASDLQVYFEELIEETGATLLLLAYPEDGEKAPSHALMNTADWFGRMSTYEGQDDVVCLEARDEKQGRNNVFALIRGSQGAFFTPQH